MGKRTGMLALLGLGLALMLSVAPAGAQVIDQDDRPADDQITRLYQAVFGRDADPGGFAFWTEQYRDRGSLHSVATQFVASQEFIDRYGANPSNEALVDAMYTNVLGRDGDANGVAFWRDRLNSGAITQVELLLAFTDSPENIQRTGTSQPLTAREAQLLRLYRSAFGRFPDAGGFEFWMGEYTATTPLRNIALRFSQSPEFTDIYGTSPRPDELVNRLYRNVLGRDGEAGGVSFWTEQYLDGQSIPELLTAFADAGENLQRTGTASNPDQVGSTSRSITRSAIRNMVLPDGTCGLTNDTGRRLTDGRTGESDFGEEITLVEAGIGFTDLDGNGATDAVIELSCYGGGNAVWTDAVLWLAGRTPRPLDFNNHSVVRVRTISTVATARTAEDVAPGRVQIAWYGASSIDSGCCPFSQITTEVSLSNGQVFLNDTSVNGPELNVVRVVDAAVVGGTRPVDLPVTQDVWDELTSWLNGTRVTYDRTAPCFRDGDDGITCLFATPDSANGISIFVYMNRTEVGATWVATDWEGIIHAT